VTSDATGIEIVRRPEGRRFRFALFDFDGTVSLLREGWQQVMIPLMVEVLTPLATGLDRDGLTRLMTDDVAETTGHPTIIQMRRLAERVRQFGGPPLDPKACKAEYNGRLLAHIAARRDAVAQGRTEPDAMLLPGARPFLEDLQRRRLVLCLASGTDEPYVREEARMLRVDGYFGPHVYGARDDVEASSKASVIARLLRENGIGGADLVVFGDGVVEIANGKEAGGYAVGVASDEAAGGGHASAWKRERLLAAGADVIIPDFVCHEALARLLFEAEA